MIKYKDINAAWIYHANSLPSSSRTYARKYSSDSTPHLHSFQILFRFKWVCRPSVSHTLCTFKHVHPFTLVSVILCTVKQNRGLNFAKTRENKTRQGRKAGRIFGNPYSNRNSDVEIQFPIHRLKSGCNTLRLTDRSWDIHFSSAFRCRPIRISDRSFQHRCRRKE